MMSVMPLRSHAPIGSALLVAAALVVASPTAHALQRRSSEPLEAAFLKALEEPETPQEASAAPPALEFLEAVPPAEIGEHVLRIPLITPPRLTGTPAAPDSDLGCLAQLSAEGVAYELAPPTEGIATPIRVPADRIGGVFYRYYYPGPKPRVFDCRLALALARAAPVLRANGVTEVIFASHYRASFGNLPRGKYHFHAQGLAMDVKEFRVGRGVLLDVARDYERGLGFQEPDSCLGRPLTPKGMLLRKIVCDLDAADVFEAILTPDYDDAHWHHFHFSAFHPAQRSRLRPRGTALLEVPITDLTAWALTRPIQQRPQARTWEAVAAAPWPAEYRRIRQDFGIAPPFADAEDAAALLEPADPWARLKRLAEQVLDRLPTDFVERLRQRYEDG